MCWSAHTTSALKLLDQARKEFSCKLSAVSQKILPTHISAESAPGPYVDFPPVHSTHDRAPIPLWYEPLAHETQGSTPFPEYVPGAHFTETKINSHWMLTWLIKLKKKKNIN